MEKTAVVLFNLGGPDTQDSVQPFLFNLFYDPAIIGLWNPFRYLLAKLISKRRKEEAQEIYRNLGGGSPLYPNTQAQAKALEERLGPGHKVFIAMRYWHPRALETVRDVKAYGPDQVVLLPLYPQYSTTTTGSSLKEWREAAAEEGLVAESLGPCCYPVDHGFVEANIDLLQEALKKIRKNQPYRILFSAHGLPKRIVEGGDPYQAQVERTVAAIVEGLGVSGLDHQVCYQSRVGPLEWIGPNIDDEMDRAAEDKKAVVVVPIAFVSEHSETLVELDIQYKEKADSLGISPYIRVPTVSCHPKFIGGLARVVAEVKAGRDLDPGCCGQFKKCPRGETPNLKTA